MKKFRTIGQIQNPERIFFDLIKDYNDGRLDRKQFFRVRVEEVDAEGGKLERNPPNPVNSLRGRVVSDGMDYNIPSAALSIYYPMNPGISVAPGEHVLCIFEDGMGLSNGLWVCVAPAFNQQVNLNNPDLFLAEQTSTAAPFRQDTQSRRVVNVDAEYGGSRLQSARNRRQVSTFQTESPFWKNKKVLMVGDELLQGFFATEIAIALRRKGIASLKQIGHYDASTEMWLDGRNRVPQAFAAVFAQEQPDIAVFFLGLNDRIKPESGRLYKQIVTDLVKLVGSTTSVLWIGPPLIYGTALKDALAKGVDRNSELKEIIQIQKSVIAKSNFIDASVETGEKGRKADGINFELKALQKLVDKVANR